MSHWRRAFVRRHGRQQRYMRHPRNIGAPEVQAFVTCPPIRVRHGARDLHRADYLVEPVSAQDVLAIAHRSASEVFVAGPYPSQKTDCQHYNDFNNQKWHIDQPGQHTLWRRGQDETEA
jgi:hypothetical protein